MTEGPTGAGRRARVGDISMFYELYGTGTPLVLIGGLGADLTMLAVWANELAEHHQVLTFDNRGAGRSDQPDQPYTIAQMAVDTTGLMDALDIPRADVMGFSMGGRIALELALTRSRAKSRAGQHLRPRSRAHHDVCADAHPVAVSVAPAAS